MRPRGVLPVIGLLLAASTVTWAMDLRDMPPWMRDMIRPVYIDWQQVAEQASLAPAGIHIWAPQQPVPAPAGVRVAAPGAAAVTAAVGSASPVAGAITPPRVTLSGSGAADAPGGTAVRAPGAVALSGHDRVHVQGLGTELVGGSPVTVGGSGAPSLPQSVSLPAGTAVRPPGAVALPGHDRVHVQGLGTELVGGAAITVGGSGAPSLPQSVSLSHTAGEWDATLASIEGMDEKSLAQAGQIITMVRERNMTPDEFVAWAGEQALSPTFLTKASVLVGPMWPRMGLPADCIAAALCSAAGEDLSNLTDIPPRGRLLVAVHLSSIAEHDACLAAMDSITDSELRELPRRALYTASSHLMMTSPRVAIAVLERFGRVLGERRMLCLEMLAVCTQLRDRRIVEETVLPFARAGLEAMPPTDWWEAALLTLVWGLRLVGDDQAAVEEGTAWLMAVKALGVDTYSRDGLAVRVELADGLLALGHAAEAREMLAGVAGAWRYAPHVADRAQAMLVSEGGTSRADASAWVVPPRLLRIAPREITVQASRSSASTRRLLVCGTASLEITRVSTTCVSVSTELGPKQFGVSGAVWEVTIGIPSGLAAGEHRGGIVISTNDPEAATQEIPISVCVTPPLTAHPDELYLGVVPCGSRRSACVSLNSTGPLDVRLQPIADHCPGLCVSLARRGPSDWELVMVLDAPKDATLCKGYVTLETSDPVQRELQVPYWAHVSDM